MSDPLDAGAQPRCPSCNVTMRPTERGDECPECGRLELYDDVQRPEDASPGLDGY